MNNKLFKEDEEYKNVASVAAKKYKQLCKNIKIKYGSGLTPFGWVLIGFIEKRIVYLGFIDANKKIILGEFKKVWAGANLVEDDKKAQEYLKNIFTKKKKFDLYIKGTDFQIDVWKSLLKIPSGTTVAYQDVANNINKPKAVRAVANAIASNHISYLIPCHRVLAKDGRIAGYRWGIQRKKDLITHEAKKEDN